MTYQLSGMPQDQDVSPKRGQHAVGVDLARARARLTRFSNSPNTGTIPQYGLVSKGGDARLQSSARERERYFDHIIRCFVDYCNIDTLSASLRQFIDESMVATPPNNVETLKPISSLDPQPVETILLSLRKLRESLLNSERDAFSKKVFLLSVRIAANIGHYQTYIPSILYLLQSPSNLTKQELVEIASLMALHEAHFTDAGSEALSTLHRYSIDNKNWKANKTFSIIQAYIHKDYYAWISLYNSETDSCKHRMMQFGESKILARMALALTLSYFTILLTDFEEALLPADMVAASFIRDTKEASTWQIDGKNLVLRQRKGVKDAIRGGNKDGARKDASKNVSEPNCSKNEDGATIR